MRRVDDEHVAMRALGEVDADAAFEQTLEEAGLPLADDQKVGGALVRDRDQRVAGLARTRDEIHLHALHLFTRFAEQTFPDLRRLDTGEHRLDERLRAEGNRGASAQ